MTDEMKELDKQIQAQTAVLAQKERDDLVQKAKDEARKEVLREVELQKQLEEATRAKAEMEKKLAEMEKRTTEEVTKVKEQVNSLISSKAVVPNDNPFKDTHSVDNFSRKQLDEIEERSARAFFGDEGFESMMRGN